MDKTTPSLDRGKLAIAEVKQRFFIVATGETFCVMGVDEDGYGTGLEQRFDDVEDAENWIDAQAARACILAQVPVSDEVVEAGAEAAYNAAGTIENYPGRSEHTKEYWRSIARAAITAAIHAIAGGENV